MTGVQTCALPILDLVEGTNGTVEALVVLVDDRLEGILQVMVQLIPSSIVVCPSNGTRVQQLESYMHRDTCAVAHHGPFRLNYV